MTVKHIRRNYAEQIPSNKPTGKMSEPTIIHPMKESAPRMALRSGESDGNKKSWIAPIVIVLILILILFILIRKGKSGTTAYFY